MAASKWDKEDRIRATIYGNCIGDAIGLATEFMTKEDVKEKYGKLKRFEFKDIGDRNNFKKGDWTDDSDQMILIMMSLLDKEGQVDPVDFAKKLQEWYQHGFPELGDINCCDVGHTTSSVIVQKQFLTNPHAAAEAIWIHGGRRGAANGGVMRTSILGCHEFWNIEKVIENTLAMCAVTHADPRCKASCVAVTTSVAFMLQGQERHLKNGQFDVEAIMSDSFELAKKLLTDQSQVAEMKDHMFAKSIADLKLDKAGIGYTFKTMGAGFWAYQQDDFRMAIEAITREYYGKLKHFEYTDFLDDLHRSRWRRGDWTDDGDQMILIMMSILDKEGKVDNMDFAVKLRDWHAHGFPELGDVVGFGIGDTTFKVVKNKEFTDRPCEIAEEVWTAGGCKTAPNGGVMRTSILGIHEFWNVEKVIENTLAICAVTHADPRCKASCVAVTTSIALILRADPKHVKKGKVNVSAVMKASFEHAKKLLTDESQVADLKKHMFAKSLSVLNLEEKGKIGYTFKTMGAGFWAFQQSDFRTAIEKVLKEGGDADTNCAVAGALLGCKLRMKGLPDSWLNGLKHKDWLDPKLDKFVEMLYKMSADAEASQ